MLPSFKLWNVTLTPIVESKIQECMEIKQYIAQKIQNNVDFEDNLDDFTRNMLLEHESVFGGSNSGSNIEDKKRSGSQSSHHTGVSGFTGFSASFIADGGINTFLQNSSDQELSFKILPQLGTIRSVPQNILENSKRMKDRINAMDRSGTKGNKSNIGMIDYNQSMAKSDLTDPNGGSYTSFLSPEKYGKSSKSNALTTSSKLKLQQSQFPSHTQRKYPNSEYPSNRFPHGGGSINGFQHGSQRSQDSQKDDVFSLSSLDRIEESLMSKKDVMGVLSKTEDTIVMYK